MIRNEDGTVTLDEGEYNDMIDQLHWLGCLKDAGVDNWSGYDYAIELKYEGLTE